MKKLFKFVLMIIIFCFFITGCSSKSSEKEFDVKNYKSMIEFKISSKPHFAVIIDKNNKINHLLFLNSESKSLYNASVEGKSIVEGLSTLMQKLWNDGYFKEKVDINLINYGDSFIFNDVYNELNKNLVVLGIDGQLIKNESSLSDLCGELGIKYENDDLALKEFDNYSKNMVK